MKKKKYIVCNYFDSLGESLDNVIVEYLYWMIRNRKIEVDIFESK